MDDREKLETTRESIINKKVTAARTLGFKIKTSERERESKLCFHCAGLCSPSKSNYENAENRNNSSDDDDDGDDGDDNDANDDDSDEVMPSHRRPLHRESFFRIIQF